MRRRLRPLAVAGLLLLPALTYLLVLSTVRLRPSGAIPPPDREAALRYLRAAVTGRDAPPLGSAFNGAAAGPLWVSLFRRGERLLQHQSLAGTLAEGLGRAARAIRESPAIRALSPAARGEIRIKVDLATARGPILTSVPILFASSIVPGLDGLGLEAGQRTAYLLPDEMIQRDLFSGFAPFPFMTEFRTGLNLDPAVDLLAERLQISAEAWSTASKRFFRFRVQSFLEEPGSGRALEVQRGRVPVRRIDRPMVHQAITRAADYVLRQIKPDGSFAYIYYPFTDQNSPPGDYSLPRHAGTTWFLSLAFGALKEKRYLDGARRAIEYLDAHAVPPGCQRTPYACIGEDRDGDLGAAALGAVAIVEYQQATGDARFEPLARRLGAFIKWMQKPNGDFCHLYDPVSRKRNCHDILLYYSGEAVFALAKLHQLTRDRAYVAPIERGLDFLTGENYDFFLGQFFISEDHWTCIAAEAAYEAVNKDQYARFCYAFAALNLRAQLESASGPLGDLQGAFAITPFFMPHNTPVGSRTEANVATYLLSVRRGEPQPEVLRSILLGIRYLVDQQFRPESTYLAPNPEAALGGMMQTPVRGNIRIDFVQHAAAAMARGLHLVPREGWPR